METFLKSLEKTPELLALVVLVYLFLKSQSESRREYVASLQEMHADSVKAGEASRECIRENTRSNNELSNAVSSLERTIKTQ